MRASPFCRLGLPAIASVLAVASPATAAKIPAKFLGVWDLQRQYCGQDSDSRVEISDRQLSFYESRFNIREVRRTKQGTFALRGVWEGEGGATGEREQLYLKFTPDQKKIVLQIPSWKPDDIKRLVKCPKEKD